LVRLLGRRLLKPKHKILGADIAGRFEAVGKNVMMLQPGDEVFGSPFMHGFGALAECVCVSEDLLAPKPATVCSSDATAEARGLLRVASIHLALPTRDLLGNPLSSSPLQCVWAGCTPLSAFRLGEELMW
jgi:hypothetical protein